MTYDPSVDAAYIYLTEIGAGEAARTYPVPPSEVGCMLNLDFSGNGTLIGIEVVGATGSLPAELLASADRPGARPPSS